MGATNIQWADFTFNPWMGCRKVAEECRFCYITSTPPFKFRGLTHGAERVRTAESTWKQPLAWNRAAARIESAWSAPLKEGYTQTGTQPARPRVFCLSLGDWLDDENVPIEWLADLLKLIHDTPNLDWLLLTKRPQNWIDRIGSVKGLSCITGCRDEDPYGRAGWLANRWLQGNAPENVWIGVSAGADQAAALGIPARIHFLSCEPMLHAVDLSLWLGDNPLNEDTVRRTDSLPVSWEGIGDRLSREHMESSNEAREEIGGLDNLTLRAKKSGEQSVQGVSSSQGNAEWRKSTRLRSQVGVSPFQRSNPAGEGCESHQRNPMGQQAGESGTSNPEREYPARGECVKNTQERESTQREQLGVQDLGYSSGNDSVPKINRGAPEEYREGLSNLGQACFTNRAWLPSKKWVIVGGESGSKARSCNVEWIRDAVRQCQAAGVPVFVKQLGAKPFDDVLIEENGHEIRETRHWRLKDSHGGDMAEWPSDLRVREFPHSA